MLAALNQAQTEKDRDNARQYRHDNAYQPDHNQADAKPKIDDLLDIDMEFLFVFPGHFIACTLTVQKNLIFDYNIFNNTCQGQIKNTFYGFFYLGKTILPC